MAPLMIFYLVRCSIPKDSQFSACPFTKHSPRAFTGVHLGCSSDPADPAQ